MKKIFNDILYYSELTLCENETAFIDKWKSNSYEIDFNLAQRLARILELDSGNWETGETHYTLDAWHDDLIPIPNSIFNRIIFLRMKINRALYIEDDIKNKMLETISEIELQYKRKAKIKKLNKI